jgi:murein DD-endopeptidase MepM/ murein hydrolase activator NlpD
MSHKQAIISLLLAGVLTLSLTSLTLAAGCAAGQTEYTVQRGDWVYKIARALGVKPEDILKANPIVNPNLLFPGQKLCIPAKTPTATATTGPTKTPAPTATPGPTSTPRPTSLPGYVCCPSFRIVAVERDKSVTIETTNFPAGLKFDVRMAARGGQAIGGTVAGSQDSGKGGVFRATFAIPAGLKGLDQIAIRLENPATGYFAFNWFYNNTATVP